MRQLIDLGHEVIPVDWKPNPVVAEIAGRCEVVPPRMSRGITPLWHLELLRRLPPVEHDVLLNPTGYPNGLGHHPRLIFYVHDLHMLQPGFYRPMKRTWFRMWQGIGLRKAHRIICPSEYTRTQLMRRYTLSPDQCVVVPNGLDPTFEFGEAADRERPYLLAVGTIEDRKNVHRIAEAYAQCRRQGIEAPLLVVGKPGHGSKLFMQRIAQPDLRDGVRVLGDVSDEELRKLYRGATALVFPSLEEGFGLPILEAMQAGTPVLTSRASATMEVAGDAALLVDPRDTESIHEGLMRLMADPDLRADLARRGHERVRDFDASVQAERLHDVLLASGRGG